VYVYSYGPWVFSDTVAVFIVWRVVGKQIGSVTQAGEKRRRRETAEEKKTTALLVARVRARTR